MTVKWMPLVLVLCVLCLAPVAHAALPGQFGEDLDTDRYNCILTLSPSRDVNATAKVEVLLDAVDAKTCTKLEITRERIVIFSVRQGKATEVKRLDAAMTPGHPYTLTVLRRGTSLGLLDGETLLFRGEVPRPTGRYATLTTGAGWKVVASVQRLEPVIFSDDFMRTSSEDSGAWTFDPSNKPNTPADWRLLTAWDMLAQFKGKFPDPNFIRSAQNPFAWVGCAGAQPFTLCSTGSPDWEDYTMSVAMQPAMGGAAGIMFNMADRQNGLLVRWSPANDAAPTGKQLALYQVTNGVRKLLTSAPGGYTPGQWYKLTAVSALDGVRILVDGRERLKSAGTTAWRGGVALYAEGEIGSVFDDVTVYGRTLDTDLLQELRQSRISDKFLSDSQGMNEWAIDVQEWKPDIANPGMNWYTDDLYGERIWMVMTLRPRAATNGTVSLLLNGDGQNPRSGYRATVQLSANPAQTVYALYRGDVKLATTTGEALAAGSDYELRFLREGANLCLEVDGDSVVTATNEQTPAGLRPGYRVEGLATYMTRNVQVISMNRADYSFAEPPTDWQTVGTWMPSIRWACTPEWSFLSGWSRGDAVLWHKQIFKGDQSIQLFAGVKMSYPREDHDYYTRYPAYLALTLCGDGKNPRNGYSAIYGAADEDGTPYRRAVIMRNGEVVASTPIPPPPQGWDTFHHHWYNLMLKRSGKKVTFTVRIYGRNYALAYTDPQPLESGSPAIWTSDNGVSLARARLSFANPPVATLPDPQVVIDTNWYPEWANVNTPLTVDLPNSWAVSGKPVRLETKAREVPANDEKAVRVDNQRVVFSPTKTGEHWYEVTATDGEQRSEPFHLNLTVFNPTLGRDDSHAILLYRFEEGKGALVHDTSGVEPAIDLVVPKQADAAQWLPGQGIAVNGGIQPLRSKNAPEKLMTIAKTRACTFEFWVSTDNMFADAVPRWHSEILAWDTVTDWRNNLALGNFSMNVKVSTRAEPYNYPWGGDPFNGYSTSLRHIVITWDGQATRAYRDGRLLNTAYINWAPETWVSANSTLMLGNQSDPNQSQPYIGNYYLVAVHDRCFTQQEIQRHFNAGPSAK